jgi:hypothetical protein
MSRQSKPLNNCGNCYHWHKCGQERGGDGLLTGRRWCRFKGEFVASHKGFKCLLWRESNCIGKKN